MKKIMTINFLFYCISMSIAQGNLNNDIEVMFLPHGYVIDALSGVGYSNFLTPSTFNMNNINPASLSNIPKASIGVSYQFETKVDPAWGFGLGHHRIIDGYPQSVCVSIPYQKLRIGFGYNQNYNSSLDFGKIPLTTAENPEGVGEYDIPKFHTNVSTVSLSLSYQFDSVFINKDKLVTGLRFGVYRLRFYEYLFNYELSSASYKYCLSLGFGYELSINPNTLLNIDMYYSQGTKFNKEDKFSYDSSVLNPYTDPVNIFGSIPDKYHLGIQTKTSMPIDFMISLTYVNWAKRRKYLDNNIEISGSTIYKITNRMSTSIGLLFIENKYDKINLFHYYSDFIKGYYLCSGIVYQYNKFKFDFSIADSHLLSGKWRKHTIFKIGIDRYL